ncbi:MAG: toll/interleukin-1 receptor domain-containing protein [Planctomycetes bacterium]|nr:toll/interleukin-1 receptor domain-containing protein [Planctomycetota bacterium]
MSEPRDTGKRDSEQTPPVIFISYAQEDEEAKDRLLPHFKQLEILELLETWNDQNIGHGPEWYADLKDRLRNTRFAICLISANYL